MASGPITSWQTDAEKVEIVADFIFLGSKFTVDSDYSYEIKMLAHWKEIYDKSRQCVKKQRHYFVNKGLSSESYVFFPVVMFGCESWTINKAECQRIYAFELCRVGEDS